MTRSRKKIFVTIVILAIAFGVAIYFAYPAAKSRYFSKSNSDSVSGTEKKQSADSTQESSPSDIVDNLSESGDASSDEAGTDLNRNNSAQNGDAEANITTEQCDSDCKAFSDDPKLLEYCQQVCGLAPSSEAANCDGKEGIAKDYCLKDLAVGKKDSSACNEIRDANIKKTCKDRILEDVLEEQGSSSSSDF